MAPEATRSRFLARMPPSHGRPHHPYAGRSRLQKYAG